MKRWSLFLALVLVGLLSARVSAQDEGDVQTIRGIIQKVEMDSISIQPVTSTGFGPVKVFKITGTSHLYEVVNAKMGDKMVVQQREIKAATLKPGDKRILAGIYFQAKDGPVLLQGALQPAK